MKKWLLPLLLLTLLLTTACAAQAQTLHITATFYPVYVTCLNLTKDVPDIELACLAPPGTGCLHDYQMTTADRKRIAQTDLLVIHGAGMDAFLNEALLKEPDAVCDASAGIELLRGANGAVNTHLWVSVPATIAQAKNIAAALIQANPANTAKYEENLAVYVEKLTALDVDLRAALTPFAGAKIATFHDAFAYWARDYGLVVAAVLVKEPGESPSARELAEVVQIVRDQNVRALFSEPQYAQETAQTISRETGVPVYTLDPVSSGNLNDPDVYLHVMETNLITMKEALQ